jgi:hypothetical protein
MSILNLHSGVLTDYHDFVRSILTDAQPAAKGGSALTVICGFSRQQKIIDPLELATGSKAGFVATFPGGL